MHVSMATLQREIPFKKEKSGKSMYVQIPDVVLLSRVEHIQKLAVCIDKRGSHENIDSSVCSCTDVFCVFFR